MSFGEGGERLRIFLETDLREGRRDVVVLLRLGDRVKHMRR